MSSSRNWDQKTIRRTFLDYFAQRPGLEHREVSSSPIIPRDDPTLLFTNAGMNQFKSLLLGQEKADYVRAASAQRCMRVGGKHNDLDAVGKDGRHLTFFEMLGNWSFGDYYKRAAIEMSWDLSINVYGLDADRIYVSVYKDDDESYALWRDVIGVPEARIYRFGNVEAGDEENFWSMGPTGPCGPCTELFYDLGPEAGTGPEDVMGGEGDRFMEYWNNVFMEFDRAKDGTTTPLALQSVDTGMGLERITMILQGQISAYDTDLFLPILREVARMAKADLRDRDQRIHMQVIADHLRALTMVLSEGGKFGNEGRDYVLRRILRRAVRHGRLLGFDEPFLWRLVPTVAEVYDGVYDLPANILDSTREALEDEEGRFFATIDRGMARIDEIIGQQVARDPDDKVIRGEDAFRLHDTYGFPVDLTSIIAEERGFTVDESGFSTHMEAQRARGRAAGTFYDDLGEWVELTDDVSGLGFAGYGLTKFDTTVVRYRQNDERVDMVLHTTPFYAESGGEVADRGRIVGPGFEFEVADVQKLNGIVHHIGSLVSGSLDGLAGSTVVTGRVDTEYRGRKMVHHTATHLLQAGLRSVLGAHVEQKGSVVEENRLRFDFAHNKAVTQSELDRVEDWVNARIRANEAVVKTESVPLTEAVEQGVVALFGEKYGEVVRTVRAGAESFELCGGNHVDRTGDIGQLVITSEGGVAAGVRRLEAVVGHAAESRNRRLTGQLRMAAATAKTDPEQLVSRIEALHNEIRALKKSLDKARRSGGAMDADELIAGKVEVAGAHVVAARVELEDRESMAALADKIRDKLPTAVVVLGAELDGKAAMLVAVGPALKKDRRFHAGQIVKGVAELVDGRGGGRPDFAQAGGHSPEKIATAIEQAARVVAGVAGV